MKKQLTFWLCNWAALLDALIGVLTIGFVVTSFDNKVTDWALKKGIFVLPNCQNDGCGSCTCDKE